MGLTGSKELIARRKIDEATSNSSLSNLRYVINADKSKWKIFRKREVAPIPAYPASLKPMKGCPCGNNGPCKQKVTPRGVTIHYPQKKSRFSKFGASRGYLPPKKETVYRARTNQQVAHQRLDEASILHFVTLCDYKGETVLCELPVNYKVLRKFILKIL